MLFLKEIEIENFKSFTRETIKLDDITSIVGANESGKSNLLDAIYHLSPNKQKISFTPDDLRIGASGYPQGEIKIKYTVQLSEILIPELLKFVPSLKSKEFELVKQGRPKEEPSWECNSNISQSQILDIIYVNNKKLFRASLKKMGFNSSQIQNKTNDNWLFNDSTMDLRKNPLKELLDNGKIQVLRGEAKLNFFNSVIKYNVLSNISLYQWRYKVEDFLQERIQIQDLIQNPNNFRTVLNMFTISGWKRKDLSQNLQNQTTNVYNNLLKAVKRNIDLLIRNQWSSHKNLTIDIQHNGDYLTVHLDEPGSSTPPEFRSDGLKWFLTFLINFRAQSQSISNYILLIDEPGLYLHPRGQKDALEEIEILAKNNQVIYTTHQTFLINKNKPEKVRIINRVTDKSGDLSAKPFYASKVTNEIKTKDILTDRLLREALGFKIADNSPINEKNVLVEGVFDREVLYLMNDYFDILDLNEISIISCGRATEIAKHCSLYKANDLKVVCFYDSDDVGKTTFSQNDRVKVHEKIQVKNFTTNNEIETIEDLFSDKVFNAAVSSWANKWKIKNFKLPDLPRLRNLKKEGYFDNDAKIEMKHSLENCILDNLKNNLKKNPDDFGAFKKILEEIKKRLN